MICDCLKFISRLHFAILDKTHRDHEEKVICVFAKVAFPEIEEVHVIDGGLSPFNFENDPRFTCLEEVVRP